MCDNADCRAVVLRTDVLDMEVLHTLMARYSLVIERNDKEIIIELYPKSLWKQQT